MFSTFIKATDNYCTLEKFVSAPYFRHTFFVNEPITCATLYITGLGFYDASVNAENITKGILAPYISNPDHYVYYDKYNITDKVLFGKNVLTAVVGNGMKNSLGGYMWDFDKASFRGAPCFSFKLILEYKSGKTEFVEPDENTKTHSSPIIFDDLRHGEYYDARLETENFDAVDFDDSSWNNSVIAEMPSGEQKLCEADAVTEVERINAVEILEFEDGYVYDFGVDFAGLCELKIKDSFAGQKITTRYFETLVNEKPFFDNVRFMNDERTAFYQENIYYCAGKDTEIHTPKFTYEGFRYVFVTGIEKNQATSDLLTYIVYSSNKKINGTFSCSNEIINRIQEATLRSDISNLYYFPTDCPHREKNGWTADAAISAEQMLINIAPERCYKEWMRNIYKAMNKDGALPGIIPTGGWGFAWGNGPAWDIVIVNLPYYTYLYRGDREILIEAAEPVNKYIHYLYSRLNSNNLLEIGLGDWAEPDLQSHLFKTPLVVTDSIVAVDILRKAQFIFANSNRGEYIDFAKKFEDKLTKAIRENLIDHENAEVFGNTQTAQAMGLYYGMFSEAEYEKAFKKFLKLIEEKNGHCHCGVVGGSIFYHLLADNGYVDLALDIITKTEFPSYGNWISRGATTLWETYRKEGEEIDSLNHHFWGFISAWFYRYLAGININPNKNNTKEVLLSPVFTDKLNEVNAKYNTVCGEMSVCWNRGADGITLSVELPQDLKCSLVLKDGYRFENTKERIMHLSGSKKIKILN